MAPSEGWRVLLIDDEEEFVTTLAERLGIRGIETEVALDGEEALRSIESAPPQVIVLDMVLPGINGASLLKRIKQRSPEIPVIILTGRRAADLERAHPDSRGADSVLIKPVDIAHVFFEILDVLKLPRSP